jgi:hypothetical protein
MQWLLPELGLPHAAGDRMAQKLTDFLKDDISCPVQSAELSTCNDNVGDVGHSSLSDEMTVPWDMVFD